MYVMLLLFTFLHGTVFAQRDTVVVYRHCPPSSAQIPTYRTPLITIDTMIIADTIPLQRLPSVIGGLSAISDVINYPRLARIAQLEGYAWLGLEIDGAGKPRNVSIRRSDAEIFNEPARIAVTKSRFAPALDLAGHAVPVKVTLPIKFSISSEPNVSMNITEICHYFSPGWVGSHYEVVLRKDGTAKYSGLPGSADSIGTWTGKFNQSYFRHLESALSWFCFFDSTFDYHQGGVTTDVATDWISVVHDGVETTRTTNPRDDRIWAIATICKWVASQIKWTRLDEAGVLKK
jgi:TonB family protein